MMDEEDGFGKDDVERGLKDDYLPRDSNVVPIPIILGNRGIGRSDRSSKMYLEQWGEETFIKSQKSLLKCQLPGTPKSTFLMVFSPDGMKAASTHGDHNIYVTDVQTGKCICTLKGHPRTPWSVAFHPSSNEIIASGCLDGQVRVWDLKGGSEVWTPDKKLVIASLAFHPSDQVLVIATDHELYFWNWICSEPFAKLSTGSIREKVKFVKFDPLGYKLITGIANVRPVHVGDPITRGATSWPARTTLFVERCRSRFDRQDPLNQDSFNQTQAGSSQNEIDPILLDFRNVAFPNRTNTVQAPEDEHRGSPRNAVLRPVSDDSASSSSLDSSSSVTSGVSGASHDRNTRLSLLWTSRPNRPGNDSDSSLGLGYDLEERRGEGSVMRRDASELRRNNGRETPAPTPEPFSNGRDSPESRRYVRDTLYRRNGRETPENRRYGRETPESRRNQRDDGSEFRRNGRETPESRRCRRNGRESFETRRVHFLSHLNALRRQRSLASLGHSTDLAQDQSDNNDSNTLRCTGQGGRWMYYHGKLHGRTSTGSSRRDAGRLSLESTDPLSAPGPSGISSGASTSATTGGGGGGDHSFQQYRSQSLLDPHFGVQLLSRHIENMQRICRSLSMPRAHFELSRHRHEINRLQQIRSMLFDIQRQIRSLRSSVDRTISEEFPSTREETSRMDSLRTSNADRFSTLQEEDPDQLRSDLLPSVTTENPVASAVESSEATSRRTTTVRNTSRLALRARHLARLQRSYIGPSSRLRSFRHRLSLPWLVRRMLSHRRTTRNRINLSAPINGAQSDDVQLTRTSVGMIGHRHRPSSRRVVPIGDRRRILATRRLDSNRTRRPTAASSTSQGEQSSHVRQRHSADWQRRIRSIATLQQPTSGSPSVTTQIPTRQVTDIVQNPVLLTSTGSVTDTVAPVNVFQSLSTSHRGLSNVSLAGPSSAFRPNPSNSDLAAATRETHAGLMEEARLSYLAIEEQVNQLSEAINDSNLESSPSMFLPSNAAPPLSETLGSSSLRISPLLFDFPAAGADAHPIDEPNDYEIDLNTYRRDPSVEIPERRTRAGPPTTALSSRIAAMLDQQEQLARVNRDRGARPRPARRRMNTGSNRSMWSGFHDPPQFPYIEDENLLLPEDGQPDQLPFVHNLNSQRQEMVQTRSRQRMSCRRSSLVTGRDLAGATLDALDSETERFRLERRDRYRVILERMAERLNRLMNRSLLTHSHRLQQEIEQEFVELSGEAPNLPPRNTAVSAALDNHMHNLRLLVRLALHLIYQLLNFICSQNISYEERPISRLPNPFREEEPPPDPSLDMELEPGLRNLTNLLETVRMASVELRQDVMEGTSSRTSGTTMSSAIRRRLTNFLYRDYTPPDSLPLMEDYPSIQRPLPRSPIVIPQLLLNDLTMEGGQSGGASVPAAAVPSLNVPSEDLMGLRHPVRVLERQNAVDRFSPDLEEPPADNEGSLNNPGPSQERCSFGSMGRHPFRFLPTRNEFSNFEVERPPGHDMYFSRPLYNQYVASRNIPVSFQEAFSPLFTGPANSTHRIQAWNFTDLQLPDISDNCSNMVVPKCKIHFDASVCISDDGNLLAALIPEAQPITRVSVFSLESKTLGQILYSSVMDSNTICVSISPTMRHLVVGIASYNHRLGVHASNNEKQVVASVYKMGENKTGRNQALEFIRHVTLERDHRQVSLNCIRWMPFPGQGLIYGTNRGQLTILH